MTLKYVLAVVVLALGCSDPNGLDGWRVTVGLVDPTHFPVLTLPEHAESGSPVAVTVATVGSSSCTRTDHTDVAVSQGTVDIVPYDLVAPPGTPCTADVQPLYRQVVIHAASGDLLLRVTARNARDEIQVFESVLRVD